MHTHASERPLMQVKEAAEELGVHPATIRRAIASGELRALRVGDHGRFRIRRSDLDALLRPVDTGGAA